MGFIVRMEPSAVCCALFSFVRAPPPHPPKFWFRNWHGPPFSDNVCVAENRHITGAFPAAYGTCVAAVDMVVLSTGRGWSRSGIGRTRRRKTSHERYGL